MIGRLPGAGWLAAALSLLFPPQCPGCGAEVSGRSAWCTRCLNELWQPRSLDTAQRGILVGSSAALSTAVANDRTRRRHSLLAERLRREALE